MDEEAAKAIEEVMNMLGNDPPTLPIDTLPASEQPEKAPEQEPEAADADAGEEQPPLVTEQESPPVPGRKRNGFVLAALVAAVISLTLVAMLVLAPLWQPTATVTILPSGNTVATTASVQVAGRALSSVMLTQARIVRATGTGHQDAQAASGAVTFYNGYTEVQAIPAGTLLQAASGVQVVTGQAASVPAAVPPMQGQATVTAYAIQAGTTGNIKAYDIYGACCRAYILVQNTAAFTGGREARTFRTVTQSALDSAVHPLKAAITQSANAAFQAQLQPGEALAPPDCVITSASDHQAQEEGMQARVTVTAACNAEAYPVQAVQAQAAQGLTIAASQQLGSGYVLTGDPHVTVTGASANGGMLRLTLRAQGTMAYQFGQEQLQAIRSRIAGMDKTQAAAWLARQKGVKAVSIAVSGIGATLPQDTSAIRYPAARIIAATDNDKEGERFAELIQSIRPDATRDSPTDAKDWNEALKNRSQGRGR